MEFQLIGYFLLLRSPASEIVFFGRIVLHCYYSTHIVARLNRTRCWQSPRLYPSTLRSRTLHARMCLRVLRIRSVRKASPLIGIKITVEAYWPLCRQAPCVALMCATCASGLRASHACRIYYAPSTTSFYFGYLVYFGYLAIQRTEGSENQNSDADEEATNKEDVCRRPPPKRSSRTRYRICVLSIFTASYIHQTLLLATPRHSLDLYPV